MFNSSPVPAALANYASNVFSSGSVMFWRCRPPIGFGLSALISPASSAMWARLTVSETPFASHTVLAEQHHLDALALHRREFPPQCGFQFSNLFLGALDHPFPRIRIVKRDHSDRSTASKKIIIISDSISYGGGIRRRKLPSSSSKQSFISFSGCRSGKLIRI
jgi:hypothetical protein